MKNVFGTLLVSTFVCWMIVSTVSAVAGAEEPMPGEAPKTVEMPKAPEVPKAIDLPKAPEAPKAIGEPKPVEPAMPVRTMKFGYVEMEKIGTESEPGKAALAQIKEKNEKLRTQIAGKQKQLEKMKGNIEAQLATLSPQQREAKAKEFQKKVEEYQKFVQNAEKELRAKQDEVTGKLFRTIERAAGEYGKANGYAAIVVKKELLYSDGSLELKDLTDDVMKLVNGKK